MPIHDWTRVDAGVFHDFHGTWIAELRQAMNRGGLPADYYAQIEQRTNQTIPDVLTLHASPPNSNPLPPPTGSQAVAVLDHPPALTRYARAQRNRVAKPRSKFLTIRHVSGHRVVAILEIVSPANKDRTGHVRQFVRKVRTALRHAVHVAVIDLFPPTAATPRGIPASIWRVYGSPLDPMPDLQQRVVASFVAKPQPESYLEYLGVGEELPRLPLFLSESYYVPLPLATTYADVFAGSPAYVRDLLSQPA